MLSEDTKILEFIRFHKSDNAYLECSIKKIDGYKNNLENSFTTKVGEHIPSGVSMSTILPLKFLENKHDVIEIKALWKSFLNL